MSYRLLTTSRFDKCLKKLPPQISAKLKPEVLKLSEQPRLGKQLKGQYKKLFSLRIVIQSVHYRVLYLVIDNKQQINLIHVGKRENIYSVLKRFAANTL
jgi:mRNA-degrading endonuclease RelE of RelBE toxin-antitoxin system